jgi:hypothetical protein
MMLVPSALRSDEADGPNADRTTGEPQAPPMP